MTSTTRDGGVGRGWRRNGSDDDDDDGKQWYRRARSGVLRGASSTEETGLAWLRRQLRRRQDTSRDTQGDISGPCSTGGPTLRPTGDLEVLRMIVGVRAPARGWSLAFTLFVGRPRGRRHRRHWTGGKTFQISIYTSRIHLPAGCMGRRRAWRRELWLLRRQQCFMPYPFLNYSQARRLYHDMP